MCRRAQTSGLEYTTKESPAMTVSTLRSTPRPRLRSIAAGGLAALVSVALAACGGPSASDSPSEASNISAGSGTGTLKVWALDGQSAENTAIQKIVSDFESSHPDIKVKMQFLPADSFAKALQTSSPADLPDVLEVDGPQIANLAYGQKIAPLSDYVSAATVQNQTDAVKGQNTVHGKLYAVSMMNSGLAMWGNKKLLDKAGVTMPKSASEAWTADEFTEVLKKLSAVVPNGKPLGIAENNGLSSEYGIYGFSPVLWSAGTPMIANGKASGALDSDTAVDALKKFASWKQFTNPDGDGTAFQSGQVALNWMGNWMYPAYDKALGNDLVVGPLPNFGKGAKTGSGTIAWSLGGHTKNGAAAGKLLDFLMSDPVVSTYTAANGAPPATKTTAASSPLYGAGKPLAFLRDQLDAACPTEDRLTQQCVAVSRPVTAGYPVVTSSFGKALTAIWGGADVAASLQAAARAIDRDFADNNNYK